MPVKAETEPQNRLFPLTGHDEILNRFFSAFSQKRLHHAWLLAGDEGIGKFRLAQQIAAWILSHLPEDGQVLFEDNQTGHIHPSTLSFDHPEARLVFGNAHPDFLIIQPDETEKNKSGQIKAEQIRKLPAFFAHHPARSAWRVAIIDNLDVVNRSGMNAMLKTLEEPPANCLLLLISSRVGQVLPTIRSRCMIAPCSTLNMQDTKAVLHHIWPESEEGTLNLLAGLSKGSPGRAEKLAEAGVLDLFEASCRLLGDEKASPAKLTGLAEKWGAGGGAHRPTRQAAYYVFSELMLLSSFYQTGVSTPSIFGQIDFIHQTAQKIAQRHSAHQIALLHQQFTKSYQLNEQLYLDFIPVMTKFFFDLHSQSANR